MAKVFCNCRFHFFHGSYYLFYDTTDTVHLITKKYIEWEEYKKVEDVRMKWKRMVDQFEPRELEYE